MTGRRLLVGLVSTLLVISALALSTGAGAAAGGCTASVGFEGPITGPVAALGREQLNFARLAVSMENAANGTKISLVPRDTQLTPSIATTVTQRMVSNANIVAVAGPAGSLEVQAVGPLFANAGMAFISGSALTATLTSGINATFFRVVPSDRLQGPEDARFIIRELHPRAGAARRRPRVLLDEFGGGDDPAAAKGGDSSRPPIGQAVADGLLGGGA
jgi:branched-chain amino acid transport system substrate-binding protein